MDIIENGIKIGSGMIILLMFIIGLINIVITLSIIAGITVCNIVISLIISGIMGSFILMIFGGIFFIGSIFACIIVGILMISTFAFTKIL